MMTLMLDYLRDLPQWLCLWNGTTLEAAAALVWLVSFADTSSSPWLEPA